MDYNRIEKLLDKYFEGDTSLQEEKDLKEFFLNNKDIPDKLIYAKELFVHLKKEKETKFDKQFIDKKPNRNKLIMFVSGIAASILIAMFLIFSGTNNENKIIYAYINGKPIMDKKIAEKYTKQILFAVSQNLDKGTKNLNKLNQLSKIEMLIKKEEK